MYLYLFWKLIARSLWSFGRREPISAQELHPSSEKHWNLALVLLIFFVTFTSRACNRVAHVLAKKVSGDDRLGEWQLAPTCVVHMLVSDCNPDWSMNEIAKSKKKDISILWSAGRSLITPLACLAKTIALGASHLSHHSRY